MKRVYLDDSEGRVALARHAGEFIDFVLAHFEVYWLTTHCRGEAQAVLNFLGRYAQPQLMNRLTAIKPTDFEVLKTEALSGDLYWLDDSPQQSELAELRRRERFDRWVEVNTRQRPDDLLFAMAELSAIV